MPTDFAFTGQRRDASASLLYYGARYYDSALGRFISADTMVHEPKNPQDLNRYAYARNNPLLYQDPTGHCPQPPASMGTAICMDLFIQPPSVQAGPWTLHGDGRGFSNNGCPKCSRGYIWIPIENTNWESYMNKTGYILPRRPSTTDSEILPDGRAIEWEGPSSANKWNVSYEEGGAIVVTYDLVLAGPAEKISPHINGTITFLPDGKGGYKAWGIRDGFPWAEAYLHDSNGNIKTIFQRPAVRGLPTDLNAIEGEYSYEWWFKFFYDFQRTITADPNAATDYIVPLDEEEK